MNIGRRSFLGRLAAGAAVVAGLRATEAEASETPALGRNCAECDRVFAVTPMPSLFSQPWPEMVTLAQQATHEKALREGISHDEAALATYFAGFPELVVDTDRVADARAEGFNDGWLQATDRAESRVAEGLPIKQARIGEGAWRLRADSATFEAMQADCEARGCRLSWDSLDDGPAIPVHRTFGKDYLRINSYVGRPIFDAQIDAWRRSLHESGG